jgi:type I restriction enzyme R subunit
VQSVQELDFEKEVVETLTTGKNQWVERKDLYMATPDKLWANLRDKINNNNYAKLHGNPLTENEFNQIKRAIEVPNPYQAAKLLAAENGIGKVEIQRDDAKEGKVVLELFWKADVAGGKSSYEVVRQAVRPALRPGDAKRRFDVTLLINGLPLIQLEFKKSTVELTKAFNQIQKYALEGKYTGIYSLIQMFVIMSPDSSAYFANAEPDKFNKSFIFKWRTSDNHPVENGIDFTKQVLNIPMAHKLVGEYTVIDEERKSLILLRPYQIYAIEAVMRRIHEHKDGFVWHTTGSGKTLTSYKTAKLAAQDPGVERVIFLVDRKDLDDQTTSNFSAYAANDDISIKEAENTGDLMRKLRENDGKVLVTSIQKLHRAVKRQQEFEKEGKTTRFGKVLQKRVIFFVDEAHRSQFGKMQKEIREAFVNSNWYGYTGTPIFNENKKQIKGELAVTTEELFGKVCHTYNIRNALEDQAVLPFNVEHVNTIEQDTLVERAFQSEKDKLIKKRAKQGRELSSFDISNLQDEVRKLSDLELEKNYIKNEDYEKGDAHLNQVVEYILKNGPRKTSLGNGNFNAILTTSSIAMAQRYYAAFKKKKKDFQNKIDPDWPRIAITYSLAENDDNSGNEHQKMSEILKDYNQQYQTNFGMDDLSAYNEDVAKRAARRESYYAHLKPSQEINLVIVVKRLLTGFDAPRLNTLFVDRMLEYQELIQAYSRTNRLQNRDLKREGQIVTFRRPAVMEENEKEAYRLYSGEGSFSIVMRPKYNEAVEQFQAAVGDLKRIAPSPNAADDLKSNADKVQFVKVFRRVANQLNSLVMYKDFTWENGEKNFGITDEEIEHYTGKFERIKHEIEVGIKDGDELAGLDFSLSISSIVKVDYDYLTNLIQDMLDQQKQYSTIAEKQEHLSEYVQEQAEISKKVNELKEIHPDDAQLINEAFPYIREKLDEYRQKEKIGKPVKELDAAELIAEFAENRLDQKTKEFAELWGLNQKALLRVAREHKIGTNIWRHEQELTESADVTQARKAQAASKAGLQFRGPLPVYRVKAQKAWRSFIENNLKVYLKR